MSKQWNSPSLQECIVEKKRYKELRPVIKLIAENKQNVVNPVIEAVGTILKNPDAKASQKLYAIRFTKDCFQQGSPLFVSRSQQQLLPIIAKILFQSIGKGKPQGADPATDDQANFILIMTECIKNWGIFLDKLQIANDFTKAYKKLLNEGLMPSASDKYFKDEAEDQFIAKMRKNAKIPEPKPAENPKPVQAKQNAAPKINIQKEVQKILSEIAKLENSSEDADRVISRVNFLQEEFDQALDSYITNTVNFDENYLNSAYEQVQTAKNIVLKKMNERKLETDRSKKSEQALEYEKLPQHVDFKKDSDQEDGDSPRRDPVLAIDPKKMKDLRTITQQSDTHQQKPINVVLQNKSYAQLEATIEALSQQNNKLHKKIQQLKNHESLEQSNHLTKELMELKRVKFTMGEQLRQLQQELKSQVYKTPTMTKPQTPIKDIKESHFEASRVSRAPLTQSQLHHHTRHLRQLMNPDNIALLKLSILNASNILYKTNNLTIKQVSKLTNHQKYILLSITLTYLVNRPCDLTTFYYNVSELDVWKKAIVKNRETEFTQEILIKLVEIPPSLLIGRADFNQSVQFCVPVLFIGYLRSGEVSADAFDSAFAQNSENILQSKVSSLDVSVVCEPDYLLRYFQHATKGRLRNDNEIVRIAFLYTPQDKVLLLWIELMKNSKVQFKVLDLEGRGRYRLAKGLLDSCVFLFTV